MAVQKSRKTPSTDGYYRGKQVIKQKEEEFDIDELEE